MAAEGNQEETTPADPVGLPAFCDLNVVFAVMVVAQLVITILAVTSPDSALGTWRGFALMTVFVQWLALAAISLMCVMRPQLARLGYGPGLFAAWLVVLAVTAAAAAAAWWIDERFGLGMSAAMPMSRFVGHSTLVSALVAAAALRYLHVQGEWQRNIRAQAEARVQALQARIRPHFLFNSMNTIASLIAVRPETAEEVVEDLADLFRSALGQQRDSDLATELELVQRYFRIEQLRLGDRLRLSWGVDALPGDARVPPLILQPLVENAVYHGIQPLPEGGTVTITGGREDKRVWIEVGNPVPPGNRPANGTGNRMAQDNIAQRLRYYYGGRGKFEAEQKDNHYRVRLTFPYRRGSHENPDR
jgi:two-component system sensor histidine kinase AlgZ